MEFYRLNSLASEIETIGDPMEFPYGMYSRFNVPETSYDCKAKLESN